MSQSNALLLIAGAVAIVVLVVLLASTRRSMSGPDSEQADPALATGKYPSGYWMTIGVCAGLALGLLLGIVVNTVTGGLLVGIGVGLVLGKWLDSRYDKNTRQYTAEEKQMRLRRASWGLIVMVLLILATLIAAILPLLD